MAWTRRTLPSNHFATGAWYHDGRWLLASYNGPQIYVTANDFVSFTTGTMPVRSPNTCVPLGACSDGTRWYIASQFGIYRSTDGFGGTAWEFVTDPFSAKSPVGARSIGFGGGKLVVVHNDGSYASSADGGTTWTQLGQITGTSTNQADYYVHYTGSAWLITAGSVSVAVGDATATTWNLRDVSAGAGWRIRNVAYTSSGEFFAVAQQLNGGSYVSTDGGVSWTKTALPDTFHLAASAGGLAYHYRETWPGSTAVLEVYASADAAAWELQDMTGLTAEWVDFLNAGDQILGTLYFNGNATGGVFTAPLAAIATGADIVVPVVINAVAPVDIVVAVVVDVAAQTGVDIVVPVRVHAAASGDIVVPVRVDALSASVIDGLPGGWAAAPDGRWQAYVWLGDDDVSARVFGEISINREDDAAATAQLTIVPSGPVAPLDLIRRRVRISFAQAGGLNAQMMYVGIVERADYNVQTGVISIDCTDNLQQSVANLTASQIDDLIGGRWSVHVSGEPADGWEYAEARIKSTPQSIALDVSGAVRVVPWRNLPRSMTVTAADVLDESVSVVLPSSSEIRTRVTAKLQYRYPRLRSRGALASLNLPFGFFASYSSGPGLVLRSWMTTGMVEQAITGQGAWSLVSQPVITQPDEGSYFVTPPDFGGYTLTPDVAATLATGFSARYETRWVQTATETYTVTLTLPDLEAQIGESVSEEIGANIQAERETADWSRDATIEPALVPPAAGDAMEAWQPAGTAAADRDNAILTLIDQSWVRLYASHRTGRVSFGLPLRPDVWLDVWATLNAYGVTAAGKVVAVTHLMDTATGEAITTVSLTIGLPGNADAAQPVATVPALPAEDLARPLTAYSFEIGAYVGGEAGAPAFDPDTMIGLVTNRVRSGAAGEDAYNFYPHQLSMLAPTIDAIDRDPAELAATVTIETAVPTDLLEIA